MKKTLIIMFIGIVAFVSCKKKENNISQLVTVSYPTVTLTGSQFYSINTGGTIPAISATAYDTTLGTPVPVTIDSSAVDVNTPGLYVILVNGKNKNGYVGSANVFIAVTNVPATTNLSGDYVRGATGSVAHVSKILNGLYLTDNAGGTDALLVSAYFVQTSDTSIDFGTQPTNDGTLSVSNATLSLAPGDTTYSYTLNASGFSATAVRTFVKQ